MTIDKAKDILTSEDFAGYSISEILEARDITLDIMSKYQKIEKIVDSKTTRMSYETGFRQIREVLKNGENNN